MNFPMECKPEVENLLPLFYENLGFPISIVRQGAAASVANTIRAYGMDIIPSIIERILFGLENVNRQLPDLCCGQMSALTISPETVSKIALRLTEYMHIFCRYDVRFNYTTIF